MTLARASLKKSTSRAYWRSTLQSSRKNWLRFVIPVATRWGSILHYLIRLLKSKNILERLVNNEETNLRRRLRSSVLDDDMLWIYVQKHRELMHPIVMWIFLLESDKAKVSRVPQCFMELNDQFTTAFQEVFWQKRSTKLLWRVSVLERTWPWKILLHILDPKFDGECLSRDERIQKTEFIDKIASRKFDTEHSADVITEHTEYRSKEGFFFFGKASVLKSACMTGLTVWWKSVGRFKISNSCSSYTKYASHFSSYVREEVSLHTACIYIKFNGETDKCKCKSDIAMH